MDYYEDYHPASTNLDDLASRLDSVEHTLGTINGEIDIITDKLDEVQEKLESIEEELAETRKIVWENNLRIRGVLSEVTTCFCWLLVAIVVSAWFFA